MSAKTWFVSSLTPPFLEALQRYHWPGNIREFMNVLEVAISQAATFPTLYLQHLRDDIRVEYSRFNMALERDDSGEAETALLALGCPLPPFQEYIESHLAKLEVSYLRDLMNRCSGDVKKAMEMSRLGRTALYDRLRKHGFKSNS